jgi:hypothetical protein
MFLLRRKHLQTAFIPCLKYGIRDSVAVPQGFSACLSYKFLTTAPKSAKTRA